MKFTIVLAGAFAALAVAAPSNTVSRRAVFSTQTYAELSISGGVAGNGEQEALDRLSGLPTDLSTVDKADLDFLDDVNGICNDVEKEVFNTAIEDATGDEADALSRGKIKNKILKLTATVLKLQAQAAQGTDTATKLADEQKKLANNIKLDEAEAGNPSTAVDFDGSVTV